jgi:hypothetical protein
VRLGSLFTSGALKNVMAIVIITPADPMSSSGFRPMRSIIAMATNVVAMLTTHVVVLMMKASSSWNQRSATVRWSGRGFVDADELLEDR